MFIHTLQVERFGKPTWRKLVKAVEEHAGGNNRALAEKIASNHPGQWPQQFKQPIKYILNFRLTNLTVWTNCGLRCNHAHFLYICNMYYFDFSVFTCNLTFSCSPKSPILGFSFASPSSNPTFKWYMHNKRWQIFHILQCVDTTYVWLASIIQCNIHIVGMSLRDPHYLVSPHITLHCIYIAFMAVYLKQLHVMYTQG